MNLSSTNPAELTELARAQGWIAPDVTITELTKPGEGNMNFVLRGRQSDGGSLIYKQAPPYVAKFPDIPAPLSRAALELEFYEAVTGTPAGGGMPTLVGAQAETQMLVVEDLGEARDFSFLYEQAHADDAATHEVIQSLLHWLSDLHEIVVDTPAVFANQEMRTLNHTHVFDLPFQAEPVVELTGELSRLKSERFTATVIAQAHELGERYLGTANDPVLLHGDFYPGSWLTDSSRWAVIDPEFAFVGPREFDLGVCQAHLRFAGFTEEVIQSLFRAYRHPYDADLAQRFAAVEVLRRIFGVAQLPLTAGDEQLGCWITGACTALDS